jgi:hypothetical protein
MGWVCTILASMSSPFKLASTFRAATWIALGAEAMPDQ